MIYILTGPVNSGKTTFLKRAARDLEEKNFRVDGFLSEALWKNKQKEGYSLYELRSRRSMPYIQRSGREGWEKIGAFFFLPDGQARARELIGQDRDADIFIVDEVGPLELSGKGVWPVLKECLDRRKQKYLLVVRTNILTGFLELLKGKEVNVLTIEDKNLFLRLVEAL